MFQKQYLGNWGMGQPWSHLFPWIIPLALLDLVLKGIALYKSARNGQKYWFIALLLVNSAGILPGIYLLFFSKPASKVKPK